MSLFAQAQSLFESGYAFTKSFSVKTKNEAGVEVVVEGEMSPKGPLGFVQGGMTRGAANKSSDSNLFSIDSIKLQSDGRVHGRVSMRTSPYSSIYVTAEDVVVQEPGKSTKSFGKIGAEARSNGTSFCDVDASVDVVNGPTLRAVGSFFYEPFGIGITTEAQVNTHWEDKFPSSSSWTPSLPSPSSSSDALSSAAHSFSSPSSSSSSPSSASSSSSPSPSSSSSPSLELEDLKVACSYKGDKWCLAAITKDNLRSLTFTYLQSVGSSEKVLLGAQLDYSLKTKNASFPSTLLFGAQYNFEDAKSSVKGKIDTNSTAAVCYSHELSKHANLNVCGSVNINSMSAISQLFGIRLLFE